MQIVFSLLGTSSQLPFYASFLTDIVQGAIDIEVSQEILDVPEPVPSQSIQGSLALHGDVLEACKITAATKVTHQPARAEVITPRKEHPGRMRLPDHLRRDVIVLDPGKDVTGLRRLEYDITEALEYFPGELFLKQFLRPIYVQPVDLTETLFIAASLPGRIMEKCMAAERLLTQMNVYKYMDHLLIHRQLQRFETLGVTISQSTSNDLMRNVLTSLTVFIKCIKNRFLAAVTCLKRFHMK